jgi:flagellar protein FliJ
VKRSRRFAPVQRFAKETERQRAQRLAEADEKVVASEAKLAELQRYHDEYAKQFTTRAGAGIGAAGLRDYQAFLARLMGAIRAQAQISERARAEREGSRAAWQHAATRALAVGHVVERWHGEERRADERREQGEADERAQHAKLANSHLSDKS